MNRELGYTHPTFDNFLQINLGPFALTDINQKEKLTGLRLVRVLKDKGFPFEHTHIGADVQLIEGSTSSPLRLICTQGSYTEEVIAFLAEKRLRDLEQDRQKTYGPLKITSAQNHEDFAAYYDTAIQKLFLTSITRTLFSDPATHKTFWYSKVNSYDPRGYLNTIIAELVRLRGFTTLVSQLNRERSAQILTDSSRTASLALTLMRLLDPSVSNKSLFAVGYACFIQRFDALFSDKDYYAGQVVSSLDEHTLDMLTSLGVWEKKPTGQPSHELDIKRVLRILQSNDIMLENHCFAIANQFVALYFTETRRVEENGYHYFEQNPAYRSIVNTLEALDQIYTNRAFYQIHRKKIERYFYNADRYFKHYIWSRMGSGGFVSEFQLKLAQQMHT